MIPYYNCLFEAIIRSICGSFKLKNFTNSLIHVGGVRCARESATYSYLEHSDEQAAH